MAIRRSIQIKPSHVGLLHEDMGIPKTQKLSLRKLQAEKEGADPAEKKRIVFAENARKFNHG